MNIDPRLHKQVKQHPYPLLFTTISGAHLYGFPSPDSDFDLRGAHLLPLADVLGLKPGEETVEKSGIHDGLEIDLVTHDIKKFMGLMLKKNGYVLEQLLSPLIVQTTPEYEELKTIAADCITKHHAYHYLGFAATQWKLFQKESPPRVKPLLYVYRVLLTGIHLMRTGEVEANLIRLNETAKFSYIPELIERKVVGPEKGTLDQADLSFHEQEYERLRSELEQAFEDSRLPETPRGAAALNDLLIRVRLKHRHQRDECSDTHIKIPKLSLVVLIGPSGSGKSTFARKHFLPTEVISSDACRAMVSDDENDQTVTNDAFEMLHYIASKRLALGRLAVVDATNVQPESRRPLVQLARKYHCLPVAIVLNAPESVCHERNRDRDDRTFGPHVVRQQRSQLRRSLNKLKREGFRHIFVMEKVDEIEGATVERVPLWNDKRDELGPFDIIGDIHGCCDELEELLEQLGYETVASDSDPLWGDAVFKHPEGRRAVFVGDLVDRGPRILDSVRIVRNMVHHGTGLCVPGNHDMKLMRKLLGKNVQITHGLAESVGEIEALPDDVRDSFSKSLVDFLDGLVSHYVLDDGKLVVAHAGMKEEMQGRGSGKVREFALYGETTGETDEFGLPVRYNWAAEYRGSANVAYGHTPVPEPEWLNRTINIDTGCVFGGKLTALRYPEKEFVSVPAKQTYCEPARPFLDEDQQAPSLTAQQMHGDVLDAEDVIGKRIISTRLGRNVTIREENSTAALEVMSRFAANPKWLMYLPPTMSPPETTGEAGLLEHPGEAFSYFRSQGVPQVVCEEKHMGSRAVVVVCRDADAARERFGVTEGESGIVYTRTGRRFFNDLALETEFLERLRSAMTAAGFWEQFNTTWACLDCELMPWSAKAQQLLQTQYAAVGAAGNASLPEVVESLKRTTERLGDNGQKVDEVLKRFGERRTSIEQFVTAYRQYCWPVESLDDLKLAPFHLLATEGKVHIDQNHVWHVETLAKVCHEDSDILLATEFKVVDVTNFDSQTVGIQWWTSLTGRGGEGMVVKPLDWVVRGKKGLVQPAVKCRGREYLRIIYGPDYTADQHLPRLRSRGLGRKRSLALREFALGIEALERFVRKEPLRRVHECVFGVLALESEPVDPRL